MATIRNMNGKLLVRYNPSCEYMRRHLTPRLMLEINAKFEDDPEAVEIYECLADFMRERCFPVITRDEINEIIADFEIYETEEEAEEGDAYELKSGRWLA